MGRLSWKLSIFLSLACFVVRANSHGSKSEPVLAICPGTCVSREAKCNSTLEGTHCGHDATCCLDGAEGVKEMGFDFSTLQTGLPGDQALDFEGNEFADQESNMGEFFLDSAPQLSAFDSLPVKTCPGACIPKKHVGLCQYIIALDICPSDKACCATKEATIKFQQEYQIADPSIIIQQGVKSAPTRCPGECVHPSLTIFCDKMLPHYECPGETKCCNKQLTTTAIPEPIECTGQCLPPQSTYFCHPPFQLVDGAVNCKEDTVCCMQVDEQATTTEIPQAESVNTEIDDLAYDETGRLYQVYSDGEFKPLSIITQDDVLNSNYAYVSDVDTEAGSTAIYRDNSGNLYQLSIIPEEELPRMTFTVSPELEPTSTEAPVTEPERVIVSMPDDSDDMEENLKDIALPDEGEDLSSKDPIPPGERTMIRPECPGSCISAFLKFTCSRDSSAYDGFSCPGRLVCCANLADIEKHEQYLKSLSPYFKAAQSVSQQHPECGITGFGGHAFAAPVTAEKWCWQAAVINELNQYMCGAAIIDNSWVLTPAHCVTGALRQEQSIYIRAGVTDLTSAEDNAVGQTIEAQSVFVHPNHNSMSLDNDMALVKLKAPFELTRNLCVVCLPTSEEVKDVCTVTGYGFLSKAGTLSLKIHEAQVSIVDDIDCIANVTDALSSVFILPSSSFCAGGSLKSCQGDAGGVLVCERNGIYELAGLVSWSLGCRRDDVPSIYAKISAFMDWINQIISASTFMKALS